MQGEEAKEGLGKRIEGGPVWGRGFVRKCLVSENYSTDNNKCDHYTIN